METKWWEVAELSRIDVSRNSLSELPEQLCAISTITQIDFSHNQLPRLFESLPQLQQLKALDVSHNPLRALPDNLAGLQALVSLTAANCQLTALPYHLGHRGMSRLAVIAAPNNMLDSLPPALVEATSLTKMDLQNNRLAVLPAHIFPGLRSLTELNVSQNKIQVLPPEIGHLARLKLLYLRENCLRTLPAALAACTSLVELHAGFNQLSSVAGELGNLAELRVLELRNNLLVEVPPGLCSLRLTLLDLTNNNLRNLPAELGFMTSLRTMPLDGNPLKSIRREVVAGPISSLLRHLQSRVVDESTSGSNECAGRPGATKAAVRSGNVFGINEAELAADAAKKLSLGGNVGQELSLKGAGLKQVPDSVWQAAPQLGRLDLSGNPIGGLHPQGLLTCTQLCSLALTNCDLRYWPLPPVPSGLPHLEELVVGRNPALPWFTPHAFVACPGLLRLDLDGVVAAGQLPQGTFMPVRTLTSLDMSRCSCTAFPFEVLQLNKLRTLNLSDNKIPEVPVHVTLLTRLEELMLTNNELVTLPAEMGLMAASLRSLGLEGNRLKTIRRALLDRGTPAVLQYLKDKLAPV